MRAGKRYLFLTIVGSFGVCAAAFVLHCAPSEDTSVDIATTCDLTKLNMSDPAEATVRVYVDTANAVRDRANTLLGRFTDICNAMNKDLGDPQGADVHGACNNIADRVAKAKSRAPVPDAGIAANWVNVTFDDTCPSDNPTEAQCLSSCSGKPACDPVSGCGEGGVVTGQCGAVCQGKCTTSGDSVACTGSCSGQCSLPYDGGAESGAPEGGLPGCQGECVGKCFAKPWLGRCSTGCGAGFVGRCDGVCTGSCDNVPNPPDPDAGAATDAGDGGDASDAAGLPGPGTCAGERRGTCVGPASGSCAAPCAGAFAGGACAGIGFCVGVCNGVELACASTCTGTCVSRGAQCSGTCDQCSGPLSNAKCSGTFDCADANPICRSVCRLEAALGAKCDAVAVDVRVAGDYKLYDAIRAHAGDFSSAARELNVILSNLGGAIQRTPSEFHSIGVVYDNARLCAATGEPIYEDARTALNQVAGASLVLRGTKF